MKILIAGAGGFIGGHLVKRLMAEGNDVLAVDIKPLNRWQQRTGAAELQLDLRKQDFCFRACHRMDEVYNLAVAGGPGTAKEDPAESLIGSLINTHLLVAARYRHVKRFLLASDVGLPEWDCQAMPADGFGLEKYFAEQLCRHFTEAGWLETRIVRLAGIYGPHGPFAGGREETPGSLCRKVAEAKRDGKKAIKIEGDGTRRRSFCFIDDCIEGLMRAMRTKHRGPLNLVAAQSVTIDSAAHIIGRIAGFKSLRLTHDKDVPKGKQTAEADPRLAQALLGWMPQIGLEPGLKKTYQWIKERIKA